MKTGKEACGWSSMEGLRGKWEKQRLRGDQVG